MHRGGTGGSLPPRHPIFVFDAVLNIVDSCAGLKGPYQIADQAVAIL